MKQPIRFVFALLLSFACFFAFGQATNRQGNGQRPSRSEHGREFLGLGPPPDEAAAARGQKLFVQTCSFCHGANATGAEGPDLLRSTVVLHDEKGELIGQVILKGRPDKGMPAFSGMPDAQIYDIAEFLHARVEEAANRFGYKMQNVVTGDPKDGEALFKQECSSCHSPTGDLAHIASKFEPADLQAQFLYPSMRGSRELTATVTLSSGEKLTGKLKRLDDFEVSLTDSEGNYHSWPRSEVKVQVNDRLVGHRELLDKYTDSDMHNLLAYLVTLK